MIEIEGIQNFQPGGMKKKNCKWNATQPSQELSKVVVLRFS